MIVYGNNHTCNKGNKSDHESYTQNDAVVVSASEISCAMQNVCIKSGCLPVDLLVRWRKGEFAVSRSLLRILARKRGV